MHDIFFIKSVHSMFSCTSATKNMFSNKDMRIIVDVDPMYMIYLKLVGIDIIYFILRNLFMWLLPV